MNLLPIPWMKQKLEVIYDTQLSGSLNLIYNNLNKPFGNITTTDLVNLIDDSNLILDNNHKIYLYVPFNINSFIKDLILSFKSISNDNILIILTDYKANHINRTNNDLIYDACIKFPELNGLIDFSILVDDSKCYELFTSLADTQRIYINPLSSSTLSAYSLNLSTDYNINHIAFVDLIDETINSEFVDSYLKGLTNKNNNFNYNF